MSLWAVAFLGSTPIGGPIIGWIGQYASPRWGLATGGFAAFAGAAFGAWALRKSRLAAREKVAVQEEMSIDTSNKVP